MLAAMAVMKYTGGGLFPEEFLSRQVSVNGRSLSKDDLCTRGECLSQRASLTGDLQNDTRL